MKRVSACLFGGFVAIAADGMRDHATRPHDSCMPGPSKSPAAFSADQAACEQYAANEVQGSVNAAQNNQVINGVIGAALGAGLGAAVAHSPATGAAIGGGAGAFAGFQGGTAGNRVASSDTTTWPTRAA